MSRVETYIGPSGPDQGGEDFTADTFLEFLRRSHPRWYSGDGAIQQEWAFRGHWDASWRLVPSAARVGDGNPLAPLIKKRLECWEECSASFRLLSDRHQNIAARIAAYADAIRSFVAECQEHGKLKEGSLTAISLNQSFEGDDITRWIKELGKEFHMLGNPLAPSIPGSRLSNVALAQHHGIPTFLLDWTWNSWIAAYFAANGPSGADDEKDICVWAFRISEAEGNKEILGNGQGKKEPDTDGELAAFLGLGSVRVNSPAKADNQYLSSQHGVLTYLLDDCGWWERDGVYPSLDDMIRGWKAEELPEGLRGEMIELAESHAKTIARRFEKEKPLMRKISLKKEHLPQLRRLLRRENITKAHLMLTMDNIAATALRHAADD